MLKGGYQIINFNNENFEENVIKTFSDIDYHTMIKNIFKITIVSGFKYDGVSYKDIIAVFNIDNDGNFTTSIYGITITIKPDGVVAHPEFIEARMFTNSSTLHRQITLRVPYGMTWREFYDKNMFNNFSPTYGSVIQVWSSSYGDRELIYNSEKTSVLSDYNEESYISPDDVISKDIQYGFIRL